MGAGRRAEDGVARRVRGEVEAAGGLAREGGGGTCACKLQILVNFLEISHSGIAIVRN